MQVKTVAPMGTRKLRLFWRLGLASALLLCGRLLSAVGRAVLPTPTREGDCPFCGGSWHLLSDGDQPLSIVHSKPLCQHYEQLSPDHYLDAVRGEAN